MMLHQDAENDPGFRDSIAAASLLSLRTVGALEFVVPALMLLAGLSVVPVPVQTAGAWVPNALLAAVGLLTFGTGWTGVGRSWPRALTSISIAISVLIIIWSAIMLSEQIVWVEHYVIGYITLVMFGAAAAVPLKPLQTLALGLALSVLYLGSTRYAEQFLGWEPSGPGMRQRIFILFVTGLCTVLTIYVYRQRWRSYVAHQQALKASEDLHEAQNRLLISENAAVFGRVAAALSHELNSPIGALASAVDTLGGIAHRLASASPGDQERLRALALEVHSSGRESAKRLREIVSRMQRFSNLDRAEIQSANLNSLLADVISIARSQAGTQTTVTADFGDLPNFVCRPQQLSAVFTNLLSNAITAAGESGSVAVRTANSGARIEISFRDNGRGIPADRLATLFDPGAFRESGGRMKAVNWSLFSCREIVREHGGDVHIETGEDGTTVRVVLPTETGTKHP
jgi:signal transduction histidine kinase